MSLNSTRVSALIAAASFLFTACGSSSDKAASSTTSGVNETSVNQPTSAAPIPGLVESTIPPETTASPVATTVATAAAPLETTTPVAGAAASNEPGSEPLDAAVAQLVTQLTGQPAEAADIACVSSKITMEDLELTSTGSDTNSDAFRKVFGAIFGCNPTGLATTFATQTFTKTEGVTEAQRTCIGTKLVEIIAASPDIILAISTDAAKPPAEFVDGATAAVKECVPAGPVQDSLLAEISES